MQSCAIIQYKFFFPKWAEKHLIVMRIENYKKRNLIKIIVFDLEVDMTRSSGIPTILVMFRLFCRNLAFDN